MTNRLQNIMILMHLRYMTLTTDIEGHGHILLPMADYVGILVRINSIRHIVCKISEFYCICTLTLTSDLGSHGHILLTMADYMGKRVAINSL